MTWPELTEQLTGLIREMSGIIREQADMLAQFEAVGDLPDRAKEAQKKAEKILKERG